MCLIRVVSLGRCSYDIDSEDDDEDPGGSRTSCGTRGFTVGGFWFFLRF